MHALRCSDSAQPRRQADMDTGKPPSGNGGHHDNSNPKPGQMGNGAKDGAGEDSNSFLFSKGRVSVEFTSSFIPLESSVLKRKQQNQHKSLGKVIVTLAYASPAFLEPL